MEQHEPPDLIRRATDPLQYDVDVQWQLESDLKSPWRQFFWKHLKSFAQEWKGKNVLDVGAGSGWFAAELQKLGSKSTGIEPSKKNCDLARRLHPDVAIFQGSFEDFSSNDLYDAITFIMSFGHIENVEAALKKSSQLLKEGGLLVSISHDFDYAKTPRHGYGLDVQPLDDGAYVVSVQRPLHGTIADIVRPNETYLRAAESSGFVLREIIPMSPTTVLMETAPSTRAFEGIPMMQMFVWEKS